MRLAVIAARTSIVRDGLAFDVATNSDGRFGPSPGAVYEEWSAFRSWADSAPLAGGVPFVAAEADAPSPAPRQLFAIGLNYRAHQIESGFEEPSEPMVFTKFASSITGPVADLRLFTDQVDWEVEAAVVIGVTAYQVAAEDAWAHVAGVTAAQDFSARDVQMRPAGTPQFSLGKSLPGFTPMGPALVTPDEFDDCDDIAVRCVINGVTVQESSTADLIFPVPELVAYLSAVLPLLPGDVILTGTPAGVGLGRNPPSYLVPGDDVVTIVGDQTLHHTAIAIPTLEAS
jgi:2-keto-4-pentenoate hydratase/2-oxohepta-3-ene-1,7-dioic acid hydratase in catechol pathway